MDSLSFIQHFHYVGLFGLLILGGLGFPFPEDVTFALAGLLLSHKVIRPVPAFIAVYTGVLVADLILYAIGRKYGPRVAALKPFAGMFTPERFARLEEKFLRKGTPYILFGRHVPGLRVQLFLVAGVMRMSAVRFILADAFSALFSVTIWGGIGYLFGYKFLALRHRFVAFEHKVILPMVGLCIVAGLIYFIVRYYKGRRDGARLQNTSRSVKRE